VFLRLDEREPGEWMMLIERLRADKADVLINNAGGRLSSRELHEVDIEESRREIELNLTTVFLGMRGVIPIMLAQGSGSVINISSISGVVGQVDAPGYQAAKATIFRGGQNWTRKRPSGGQYCTRFHSKGRGKSADQERGGHLCSAGYSSQRHRAGWHRDAGGTHARHTS
jgi:short chain dehydrogenase